MPTIANIAVALIALVHVNILVLEMFLWDKPAGLRAFGQTLRRQRPARSWQRTRGCITVFWLPACSGA
jgi:putative membrane protein